MNNLKLDEQKIANQQDCRIPQPNQYIINQYKKGKITTKIGQFAKLGF